MITWIKSLKWLTLGCAVLSLSVGAQQLFNEGKDYQRLKDLPAAVSDTKIEVVEFFSYGCIHCSHLEEYLGPWTQKVPANISFKRVPVIFQPAWESFAKIYFTLEAMDKDKALTAKVFQAIHQANIKLSDEAVFFDWAGKNGLDVAKVKEVWGSFAVNSKVSQAKTLARNYQVDSTPMLFIDGKFKFSPGALKNGHKDVGAVLDFLIAKARSERKS